MCSTRQNKPASEFVNQKVDLESTVLLVIRCVGQQRYLSGRMVEFTENPLTRFDEEVKLARAYDQWVSLS
jgi:hypothetical protein